MLWDIKLCFLRRCRCCFFVIGVELRSVVEVYGVLSLRSLICGFLEKRFVNFWFGEGNRFMNRYSEYGENRMEGDIIVGVGGGKFSMAMEGFVVGI